MIPQSSLYRNNVVFLVGEVLTYARRESELDGKRVPVLDLILLTDKTTVSGRHKVMVYGKQAVETGYLLVSVKDSFLELMVLGWLFSGQEEVVVIAERVTAVVDHKTRSLAFSALSHSRKGGETNAA